MRSAVTELLLCGLLFSAGTVSAFISPLVLSQTRYAHAQAACTRRFFPVLRGPTLLHMSVEKKVVDSACSEYTIAVLGDLHLDGADMDQHSEGREHIKQALAVNPGASTRLVSLGDLGAYGIAGTTSSFKLAKEYLDGFGVGWDVVTGNHDLEGMDEFETDAENLKAFCDHLDTAHHFCTQVADKVVLVGLSTVRFRDTAFSSHECYVDEQQLSWFEEMLAAHPAEDGWSVLVFSHAPIMGSGLRTLQDVHIKNGCAWINHSDEKTRKRCYQLCLAHPQIRAWFNGHFHLSHDYQESISLAANDQAFVQVGVMGGKWTRDGRRQSRLVRGDSRGFSISTINHHKGGEERTDLQVTFKGPGEQPEIALYTLHEDHIDVNDACWFSARTPEAEHGCFLARTRNSDPEAHAVAVTDVTKDGVVRWWHMGDGRVLGVHDGLLVEYDADTLAPLGVVVDKTQMQNRQVVIADNGHSLMLVQQTGSTAETTAVHPNEDGSYSRQFQRNKLARTREKQRAALAELDAQRLSAKGQGLRAEQTGSRAEGNKGATT